MVWFLIALLVGLGVVYWFYRNKDKDAAFSVDTFKTEVKEEVAKVEEKVVAEVKKTLDVNKDGKVDLADAKAAVKKVRTPAKKAAPKAKPAAKKPKTPKLKVAK
jgi:protein involved in sex pheromone biosynthesis